MNKGTTFLYLSRFVGHFIEKKEAVARPVGAMLTNLAVVCFKGSGYVLAYWSSLWCIVTSIAAIYVVLVYCIHVCALCTHTTQTHFLFTHQPVRMYVLFHSLLYCIG